MKHTVVDSQQTTLTKFSVAVMLPLALLAFTSCSNHHPPTAAKVGSAPAPSTSGFGGEVVVNSVTATATVVSIDDANHRIVLKRTDGRLAHCRARPGVVEFSGVKVGDTVSIGVAEELAVAMGKTVLPVPTAEETAQIQVHVPEGVKALADAVEILSFTAKVIAVDDWNDAVKLQLTDGQTRTVRVSEAVNLADVTPGDEVSVRITDAVALIVK